MKHIRAVSIAIVATGFLSGSSRPAPGSRFVPPRAVSATPRMVPETRSFAYRNGKDGRGSETVTRNGDLISGNMAVGANHVHYEGRIAADGTIPRFDIRAWHSAAEERNPRVMSAIVGRDRTLLIEHLGGHVDTVRFATQPGLLPVINPSMGLLELVVARARAQKSQSARIPILNINALFLDTPDTGKVWAEAQTIDVTFLAADTVRLGNGASTDQMRVFIGADGRCRGAVNGTTAKDTFSARPTSKPVSSRQ